MPYRLTPIACQAMSCTSKKSRKQSPLLFVGTVVAAMFVLGTIAVAQATEEDAETAIKKLGGFVRRDKNQPGAPIIAVNLSRKKLSAADLALIGGLRHLNRLSLLECAITDDGMKYLAKLVNLEELDFEANVLTDAGLKQIQGMTKLRRFTVSCSDVTDAGLVHLKGLKSLTILRVMKSAKITDKGMVHLAELENLEELDLSSNALTGSGLVALRKLPRLKVLALRYNRLRDAELRHLKDIKSLEEVQLAGNFHLTDAAVPALKELKNIKQINLHFTKISDKGIADLKKALPRADITRE